MHRLRLACALSAMISGALPACFQAIDEGTVGGSLPVPGNSVLRDGSAPDPDAPFLPPPFSVDAALAGPCEAGSALCFQLCNSPSCALEDHSIPPELATPPARLPDGGTSSNPCDAISARAYQIRAQACAQCHAPPQDVVYDFVLDDSALVTEVPSGTSTPLVIPGNPAGSPLIQKVARGLAGDPSGMPPPSETAAQAGGISSAAAASIVYPTPEDFSVLQAWVLACVNDNDGGVYSSQYYGGSYGPEAGSTPGALDAGTASRTPGDAAGP